MTLFPWLVVGLLLLAAAVLAVTAPGAAYRAARRRRPVLSRPAGRAVLALLLVEAAIVLAWMLTLRQR